MSVVHSAHVSVHTKCLHHHTLKWVPEILTVPAPRVENFGSSYSGPHRPYHAASALDHSLTRHGHQNGGQSIQLKVLFLELGIRHCAPGKISLFFGIYLRVVAYSGTGLSRKCLNHNNYEVAGVF